MKRSSQAKRSGLFLSLPLSLAGLLVLASGCGEKIQSKPAYERGLIIMGVDGMDPILLRQYMAEGLVPNLKALAEKNGLIELGTSNPPQSPVAWSTFITGADSHTHGIYDFVHRDPKLLAPFLSTSRASVPKVRCLGSQSVSLGSPEMELLRHGRAFWQDLDDAGIPSTALKIPANFPPTETVAAESMSGMGTPDIKGTYGVFQFLTNDPTFAPDPSAATHSETEAKLSKTRKYLAGGVAHWLDFKDGQTAKAQLEGPPNDNPCVEGDETAVLDAPVSVTVDEDEPTALIRFGDREILLREGDWSEWEPIGFEVGMVSGDVPGIVRFYLGSVRPHVRIYVTPVNLDPKSPLMPISSPETYVSGMAKDLGRFYTQGMPEDTKALAAGVLTEDEFLSQAELVIHEREQMLDRELARFKGGLLFFYISSVDQLSHVYFRSLDPNRPEADRQYKDVIPDAYARADAMVGKALKLAGPGTEVIVMSDHGFSLYEKKVNLNSWLVENGYLALLDGDKIRKGDPLGHIDWGNTQAYAIGINGLFLNIKGREAHGVVPADEAPVIMRRLKRDLLSMTDPENRKPVITSLEEPPHDTFPNLAPDFLVGYNKGYRSSDVSAQGLVGAEVLEINRDKWSGDHCMDPRVVPGILMATKPITAQNPNLENFAATVLDYFDVPRPADLQGESLWQKK